MISWLSSLVRLVARQQADIAAKDQRVAQIAVVKVDRSVNCGNTHPIAVITHASNDALHDAPRMQYTRRQRVGGHVGRGKAEDIGVADGLSAEARSQRVANHSTHARVSAAIR